MEQRFRVESDRTTQQGYPMLYIPDCILNISESFSSFICLYLYIPHKAHRQKQQMSADNPAMRTVTNAPIVLESDTTTVGACFGA